MSTASLGLPGSLQHFLDLGEALLQLLNLPLLFLDDLIQPLDCGEGDTRLVEWGDRLIVGLQVEKLVERGMEILRHRADVPDTFAFVPVAPFAQGHGRHLGQHQLRVHGREVCLAFPVGSVHPTAAETEIPPAARVNDAGGGDEVALVTQVHPFARVEIKPRPTVRPHAKLIVPLGSEIGILGIRPDKGPGVVGLGAATGGKGVIGGTVLITARDGCVLSVDLDPVIEATGDGPEIGVSLNPVKIAAADRAVGDTETNFVALSSADAAFGVFLLNHVLAAPADGRGAGLGLDEILEAAANRAGR